jgi:hypothetical protein
VGADVNQLNMMFQQIVSETKWAFFVSKTITSHPI